LVVAFFLKDMRCVTKCHGKKKERKKERKKEKIKKYCASLGHPYLMVKK
jgi:hypothetical protein